MMNKDEKLEKICKDFSILNEEQQDYILGIMQALVFAKTVNQTASQNTCTQATSEQNSGNQNESKNQPLSDNK